MSKALPPQPCTFLLSTCRSGFENECAEELQGFAAAQGHVGEIELQPMSGWVRLCFDTIYPFEQINRAIRLCDLTFSRQLSFGFASVAAMNDGDRVTPIVEAARGAATPFSALLPEASDSDSGRPLAGFCRRLEAPLVRNFDRVGMLRPKKVQLPRLHVFFASQQLAHLALSHADNASPWPMGIPRLRMPGGAPSRSTLKLAEALTSLLSAEELELRMRAGQRAVDLGAAPGGWTWQLAWRGLRVTAIDNGTMADSVMRTEMVEHLRADGFTWHPPKPLDWMVCDMVEQPARIAALVAEWVASGRCRFSIFNLKLPMKRRLEELERCRQLIHQRLRREQLGYVLRIRQLYHDREEVTGYLEALR